MMVHDSQNNGRRQRDRRYSRRLDDLQNLGNLDAVLACPLLDFGSELEEQHRTRPLLRTLTHIASRDGPPRSEPSVKRVTTACSSCERFVSSTALEAIACMDADCLAMAEETWSVVAAFETATFEMLLDRLRPSPARPPAAHA